MTNSKRSARNDDAAAVEWQTAAENSQFPATAAASIAAVHESAFGTKRTSHD
jgi:hypothetical protein